MEVHIDRISKRFATHWIFRDLSAVILPSSHVAITGPNGSGKSTLLKIIAGALYPTSGSISYKINGIGVSREDIFGKLVFAAPYVDMVEEMSLMEAMRFHLRFRSLIPEIPDINAFMAALQFEFDPDQPLHLMSSGMKQRLRIAFAVFTNSSLVLLDEPTVTLDDQGLEWFAGIIRAYSGTRTVVIASNQQTDLISCTSEIALAI